MAIDRGPWNGLVDDDGSNLVGTVWNKDAIKTVILDPTDAAITAAVGAVGTWASVPFSAANFPNTPGITAGMVSLNRYTVIGKTLIWAMKLVAAPPCNEQQVFFIVPGGYTIVDTVAPLSHGYDGATYSPGYLQRLDTTRLGAIKGTATNWVGTTYIFFTAIVIIN